jgi:hypothetical protein
LVYFIHNHFCEKKPEMELVLDGNAQSPPPWTACGVAEEKLLGFAKQFGHNADHYDIRLLDTRIPDPSCR